jgi:8-oxo-dGTP pyrophosphatase MutT (NUDIX family)
VDFWFLPGGRIKTGESSTDAMRRELEEELGTGFAVEDLMIVAENFFTLDGDDFHEFCFLYRVTWNGHPGSEASAPEGEEFRWVTVSELEKVNLKPVFLKRYLTEGPSGLVHVVHRDS